MTPTDTTPLDDGVKKTPAEIAAEVSNEVEEILRMLGDQYRRAMAAEKRDRPDGE